MAEMKTVMGKTVGQRYRDAALAEQAVIGVLDVVQIMGLPKELIDAVYVAHERREDLYTALADREAAQHAATVAIDDALGTTPDELALIDLIEARDERVARYAKGTDLPPLRPRAFARQLLAALDAAREAWSLTATEAILLHELEECSPMSVAEIGMRLRGWGVPKIDDSLRRLEGVGAVVAVDGGKWAPVEGWSGLGRIEG